MIPMLDITLYILLLLISLAAVSINVISLPGNWIMLVAAAGWSAYHAWNTPSWPVLAGMLLALLMAEVVELMGSVVGARQFGATKMAGVASIVGAFVGGIIGTLFLPIIGSIVGAIAGAFLAAWIVELINQRPLWPATKAAFGAALGRGVGLMAKVCFGLAVWLALAIFGFPR